ncbi:Deoxyguanosinetriphosphate triphosphohydrolase [Providencia rustigianii]|uniref:Deoxyguanosinetriphosphate triphosphohydrolase n=2 Tax=Providencia rustigianii TaxID=158850 RepID=D1P4I0_9GAMM|nr:MULTISPECIES: dGTPase [Providencia]EFB71806.1 putative dGTPase [Providencia rustigianii DSM 4541]MTC55524.1 dGTPase [Providencia rustigianii]MTC60645.1 dGTPase [Providencia rustigianii]SPY78510.1 Deoxyguanosinetriphosphate triphosphohydrolase [Providencia rustigianii]SUC28139.1 Deoxyguanosinetriphosphate triphosphohydrolase [Providencia rustigianii]
MREINFLKKLSFQRNYISAKGQKVSPLDEDAVNRLFESDRGRIINSAAIRRLQQKTQVFPLEQNSAVRSRLTHSLEVQQVGRYISKTVLGELKKKKLLDEYGLTDRCDAFESLVEMSCLMHDIGNPPFGHFGEAAIQRWFSKLLAPDYIFSPEAPDPCRIKALQLTGNEKQDLFRRQLKRDLCSFEGNAQGLRMAHRLLKLNLTYAQIGSILKYTRGAYDLDPIPAEFDYLMKKPGYYWSEADFVSELSKKLDMDPYCRFPLTYIMEAADDISYCIADLDDAAEKGIFTVEQLIDYLNVEWGEVKPGDLFDQTIMRAFNNISDNHTRRIQQDQFFMYLRVNITGKLAHYSAQRFIQNLPEIYHGSFNSALLEDKSQEHRLLKVLKMVAFKHVFNHHEVEELELQGYRIISGLLDVYSPLLMMDRDDFASLVEQNYHKHFFIETRLFHKLSNKHRLSYNEALEKISATNDADRSILEFYYRARLIQDYISGMTDHYAYEEYRKFMVTN